MEMKESKLVWRSSLGMPGSEVSSSLWAAGTSVVIVRFVSVSVGASSFGSAAGVGIVSFVEDMVEFGGVVEFGAMSVQSCSRDACM